MKKLITIFLPFIILSFFQGFTDPVDSFGDSGDKFSKKISEKTLGDESIFQPSYYLSKSKMFERIDELQLALFYMKIAGALSPDNPEISDKMSDLKSKIDIKSGGSFEKGRKFYNQNRFEEARIQFLTALRYKPDHDSAIDYLKNNLIPKEYILYSPKKDNSLKSISEKFYKDPGLDFLITYFNDLGTDAEPVPGQPLKLPVLEPDFNQTAIDIRQKIIAAKDFLEKKRYQEVVDLTDKILKNDRSNKVAIDLRNEAFYQAGTRLSHQEKHFEALNMFNKITPGYKNIDKAIQDAIHKEFLKAELLLKENKYEASIQLAEKILSHDPSNRATKDLINTAHCQHGRSLLIRKKYAEALKILDETDPANDCADKIRSAVQKAITSQAESHYLRGVKYFLNEELQNAIKEWEKTLELNPSHDKAKKNIKNAKSLLEKLKKVN